MNIVASAVLGLCLPPIILFLSSENRDFTVPTKEDINAAKVHAIERLQNISEKLPLDNLETSFWQVVDNVVENVQDLKKTIPQIIKGE